MTQDNRVEIRIKIDAPSYAFMLRKFGAHKAQGGKMNYGDFVGWFVSNMIDELSGEQTPKAQVENAFQVGLPL